MYEERKNKDVINKVSRQMEVGRKQRVKMEDSYEKNYCNSKEYSIHFLQKQIQLRKIGKDKINEFETTTFDYSYSFYNGKFNSKYIPQDKSLNITLPVSYTMEQMEIFDDNVSNKKYRDLEEKEKQLFKESVEKTWSNKWKIKTNIKSIGKIFAKSWDSLNPVKVNVKVEEKGDGTSFFKITGNTSNFLSDNMVWHGKALLSNSGYNMSFYTMHPFRYWRSDISKSNIGKVIHDENESDFPDKLPNYNIYAHEAGHMFGLDDEYDLGSDKAAHYELTKKAFGEKYADENAKRNNSDINSLMSQGVVVKKHHYVTFWDSMIKSIQQKYPNETSNDVPNQYEDWEIK